MNESTASSTLTRTGHLNKFALTSIVLALIAVSGVWLFGMTVLAVFAVGAGHVSLGQITQSGERGRWLAMVSLIICYALASWAVFNMLMYYIPALIQQ